MSGGSEFERQRQLTALLPETLKQVEPRMVASMLTWLLLLSCGSR